MSISELIGVIFLTFFAANSVLARAAGLDSAERFSRDPGHVLKFAAAITTSALVSDAIAFALLVYVLPAFGAGASTLLDGVVVVLSVLMTAVAAEVIADRFVSSIRDLFGEDLFSVTYNSAVVGIVLLCRAYADGFVRSLIYCILISASVVMIYYLISVLRSDLCEHRIPKTFRGAPIFFLLLGIAAMVICGYAGASLPEFDFGEIFA